MKNVLFVIIMMFCQDISFADSNTAKDEQSINLEENKTKIYNQQISSLANVAFSLAEVKESQADYVKAFYYYRQASELEPENEVYKVKLTNFKKQFGIKN